MSEFESYFKKNRNSMDVEETPRNGWQALANRLNKTPKRRRWMRPLGIAAALAICFTIGFMTRQAVNSTGDRSAASFVLANYSTELASIDAMYTPVIQRNLDEIRNLPDYATDTSRFSIFISQFQNLEKQNTFYLKELKQHGYDDAIVEELIRNYSYKLDLLKRLKKEISNYNNQIKSIGYEKKPNYIAI